MRVLVSSILIFAASCSCSRNEQKEYNVLITKISAFQTDIVQADAGAAKIDGLERLADLYDELATLNEEQEERACSRANAFKERLACKFGSECRDPELMCTFTRAMNQENAQWRTRAKEARDAAAGLRSSLPPRAAE